MKARFVCVMLILLVIVACSSTYNPNEPLTVRDVKIAMIPGSNDRILIIEAILLLPVARETDPKKDVLLVMQELNPSKKLEEFIGEIKKGDKIYVKYFVEWIGERNTRRGLFEEITTSTKKYVR